VAILLNGLQFSYHVQQIETPRIEDVPRSLRAFLRVDPTHQSSPKAQSHGVTTTRTTVGSIGGADPFHELSIALSFDEG